MNREPDDDAALAARIRAGGAPARAAEAEVCRRYARPVRLYGLKRYGAEDRAADLVQQVLMMVLQKLRSGEVREPERLASFVLGTCRLVVRDDVRTTERRRTLLETFPFDDVIEPPATVDRAHLSACLDLLAPRDRQVVALSFWAERSSTEMAEDLGTTPANVRVVRHRALARLATCVRQRRGEA